MIQRTKNWSEAIGPQGRQDSVIERTQTWSEAIGPPGMAGFCDAAN